MSDIDGKIADLQKKIQIEQKLRDGAYAMLKSLKNQNLRNDAEMKAVESQRRIEYLEGEMRKLQLRSASVSSISTGESTPTPTSPGQTRNVMWSARQSSLHDEGMVPASTVGSSKSPQPARAGSGLREFMGTIGRPFGGSPGASNPGTPKAGSATGSQTSLGPEPVTKFDYLRLNTALTSDKIKYRLREVRHKLDVEQRVKSGTENLVAAMARTPTAGTDPKVRLELEEKLSDVVAKVAFLTKAEHRYAGLYVEDDENDEEYLQDVRQRRTGRLKIRLIGATNLPGRRASHEEILAIIRVDGNKKYTTRPTKNRWDEMIDIQVDKAQEVEISVYEKGGVLLSMIWFRIYELEDDLKVKYGSAHETQDVEESLLDMEPAGQLFVKLNFHAVGRTKTARDQVFRRAAVQKVYPRNGHRFLAQAFYQVMQCALCNEFLGHQGYTCQHCHYTVHARCYQRVITKCIPADVIQRGEDSNTGQLLKYKIPHRWDAVTNLGAAWCSHCGYICTPGRKIHRCTECSKSAHKECSAMVPYFCGLAPEMADTLVAAFEEHEKRLHQKEMEEADKLRKESERVGEEVQPAYPVRVESSEALLPPAQTPPTEQPPIAPRYDVPAPGPELPTRPDVAPQYPTHPYPQQYPYPTAQHPYPSPSQGYPPSNIYPSAQQPYSQAQQYPPVQVVPQPYTPQQQVQQYPEYFPPPQQQQPFIPPQQQQYQPPPTQPRPSQAQHPEPLPPSQPRPVAQAPAPQAPVIPERPSQVAPMKKGTIRLPPTDVKLEDFAFQSVLGRGAFGKVMLAKENQTGSLYAIKALKKEFIIQNDDVKSTKLEKRIFQAASAVHHPFLVNLHSCFQTDSRIYFVMEYVPGGDLMAHIQNNKRFTQARAKFYACEVLLALEYFHKMNIVYRDLKLDNILMERDGHIKVADYGICKENMPYGQTTRTFCGTPDYMAPEILMSNRYGRAVDWWSFGVLIYVMLIGRYPFHGEDETDILDAILEDAIEYPSNMPGATLSLLQGLMNKNPARRLGGGRSDAAEVKAHPYFAGQDWNAYLEKRIPPPFVPTIAHAGDVSNFDPEFTRERPVLTPINSVLSAADQREFNDFTFVSEWAKQARVQVAAH
ncbi:Serine/threonine kinase [Rhizophlyctis rosea]|nr:Serine/threonine kinase [Rhizophlyctis rosea]